MVPGPQLGKLGCLHLDDTENSGNLRQIPAGNVSSKIGVLTNSALDRSASLLRSRRLKGLWHGVT
jgi:hypothetical protein